MFKAFAVMIAPVLISVLGLTDGGVIRGLIRAGMEMIYFRKRDVEGGVVTHT
jgi:hypothetical protein